MLVAKVYDTEPSGVGIGVGVIVPVGAIVLVETGVSVDAGVVGLFFLLHATDSKDRAKITQSIEIKVFFIVSPPSRIGFLNFKF
jgi:hypothetical protein